ncbi:MAG: hypothetical protein JWO93_297, partial [Micrococcaceae bacterium]|nr:hypothetical protein [Micrococcaceae bacterium]
MAKSRYARVAWLLVAAACGMYALQFLVHLLQGESMADSAAAAATAVLALLLVAPFGLLLGSRMGRTQQRLREQGRHHCHVRFPQEPGSPRKWRRRIVTPSANKLRLQPVLGQTSIATGTELTLAVVPAGRYERHPTTRWDRLNVLG